MPLLVCSGKLKIVRDLPAQLRLDNDYIMFCNELVKVVQTCPVLHQL